MTAVDETADALVEVARALVRAAGQELLTEVAETRLLDIIDNLEAEANRWLRSGLTPETDSETEDQCARAVLKIIGRPEK